MASEFKLPDLGEGIHEAQVLNIKIKEGDVVKEDQMIMEVETDKAAVEIPVPYAGVVSRVFVKAGQTVQVGQPLLAVETAGSAASPAATLAAEPVRPAPAAPSRPAPAPAPRPAPAPAPRPAMTPARPPAAPPKPLHAQIGDSAPRGVTTPTPVRLAAEAPPRPAAPYRASDAGPAAPVPAAPAIRRLAREMNIDLSQVRGTGPGGRIVREDLERFALAGPSGTGPGTGTMSWDEATSATTTTIVTPPPFVAPPPSSEPALRSAPAPMPRTTPASAPALRPAAPSAPAGSEALPDFSQWGPVRREPVSQIRKTIARQMTRSYTIVPHVTHCDTADVTDIDLFRREHGKIFHDKGTKLTLTAIIIKAVAGALRQFPQLNCSFDHDANEIIYKDYVHVGVAVDTPRGLVVPVIRDCDRKSLMRISQDLNDLAERARAAKFDLAELRGGTFTITNVGPLGGTFVTPMINYPEVAILGLGRTAPTPVVRDGQIVARQVLPLSLSFDHRVIDGADAARFTRTVISYLESPLNLLLVS